MEKQKVLDLIPKNLHEQLFEEVGELLSKKEESVSVAKDVKEWADQKNKLSNTNK